MLALVAALPARPAAAQCPRYEVYAEIDAASCNATLYIRGWSPKNDYICGGIKCGSGDLHAFVWWGEGGLDILPMPAGTWAAEAFDVNDSGIVVGRVGISGSGYTDQAFRYDRATKQLSMLTPPAESNSSIAVSITEAGLIAGHLIPGHGFLWLWDTDTVTSIEPMIEGVGDASRISDVSDSGYIVGHFQTPGQGSFNQAFRLSMSDWTFDAIPHLPDGDLQDAYAVTEAGVVCGYCRVPDPSGEHLYGVTHGYEWNGSSLIEYRPLPRYSQSRCRAVSCPGMITIDLTSTSSGSASAIGRGGRVFLFDDIVVDAPGPGLRLPWTMHPDGRIATYTVAYGNDADLVLLRPIEPVLGDATCDGRVGFDDLVDVLTAWSRCDDGFADVDRSGCVDLSDVELVIAAWDGG